MSGLAAAPPTPSTALWVVPVSNLAGVARHVLDVVEVGLPGWRLVVAAPEGPLLERLRELQTTAAWTVTIEPVELGPNVRVDRAVRRLRRVITRVKPQVVHAHLARADLLSAMATVGLPTRLVTTEHHIPPDQLMFHHTLVRARIMQAIHHLRLRRCHAAMAVSASTQRDMLAQWRPQLPITVVLNGVDRRPAINRTPGYRFLSLARLSPEKNLDFTLQVFAQIVAAEPRARLTLAGEGPLDAQLKARADELGLGDRVEFPGHVDPHLAMASHDVVLQPSKSDNCSYTLLDAVAAGMGVAASPIGGNPEIVPSHCIAGLDDPAAFAAVALSQARTIAARPTLPATVPTRAEMASRIVGEYDRAWSRR